MNRNHKNKHPPRKSWRQNPPARPPVQPARQPGMPWLYGRHAVEAALGNPARRCRRFIALNETAAEARALLEAARAETPAAGLEVLDRREFERLLPPGAVHQGLALAAEKLAERDLNAFIVDLPQGKEPQVVVVLDQVTDPHNVGAILRSAAAFGALAVLVPEHGAPAVTGVLAKAASGALEEMPLLRVANLARALEQLKNAGFWSLGLEENAERALGELDLPARIALVLGAEGSGLRRLTREHCDFLGRLPTRGSMASLNVSNAAAVALYALSQRAQAG
ncbi:MAG: 23S rRNA (guanosine(2251)-2'-O)-methyltransferase RlmB [Stellaceae bacterium]|jgi:23S rRNA (guanosine2251-2'-O)-methyltransferase